jgi:hypothetical protein
MRLTILTAITGVVLVVFIVELLRRRQLREKYVVLWLVVGVAAIPLAFFPDLIDKAADLVGVSYGVNLILFLGIMFLLLTCIHLSWEVSRLEEKTRVLAEEVALLRARMDAQAPTRSAPARPGALATAEAIDGGAER